MVEEKIEILSVELLDNHPDLVKEIKDLSRLLRISLGWHYLLDLTWIISQLGEVRGKQIMDAGAGLGIMQWYLADQGAEVFSVDRVSRAEISLRLRSHYQIQGLRPVDLRSPSELLKTKIHKPATIYKKAEAWIRGVVGFFLITISKPKGQIIIYNQDLQNLVDISNNSLDAIVSVSALEHNSPEGLERVVTELLRKLKPGGLLLSTLGAAKGKDWFHQPSQGWCYTDTTLRRLFGLLKIVPSNYQQYDILLEALKECTDLRDNLAEFYFQSGNNGMPWGIWDPKYQPVGICKIKI